MSEALVPSISIEALVQRRNTMVERTKAMFQNMADLCDLGAATFGANEYGNARFHGFVLEERELHAYVCPQDLPRFINAIDAQIWAHLLDKSGLRTFMDAQARKKWDKGIRDGKVPEVTVANIQATFQAMHKDRGEMFERGIINMFRSLSWDYKMNLPHRLGKRIVVRNSIWTYRNNGKIEIMGVQYEAINRLDDMLRVFHVLDGKPEPDHRRGSGVLLNEAGWPKQDRVADLHGYLKVRGFQNGNMHVTFLRADLIDELNRILARHYPNALPPAEEK